MELLAECPPALRGWEWYHLKNRRRFDEPKPDHTNVDVAAVAFHPTGKILATGYGDKRIAIWEAGDDGLKPLRTLKAHEFHTTSLAFNRDGRHLVSASFDGTAKVWDTSTWEVLAALEGEPLGQLWCAAIHPDGRRIALAGFNKVVGLWDPESNELRDFIGHADRVTGVAFTPMAGSSPPRATTRPYVSGTPKPVGRSAATAIRAGSPSVASRSRSRAATWRRVAAAAS